MNTTKNQVGFLRTTSRSVLLTLLLLLSTLPAVVPAQDFTYTTNNGTLTIIRYTGSGGAVDIPSTINGLPVTSIRDWAFAYSVVTSVTIPDSVTIIGEGVFRWCNSLTIVTIPNSVTSIGNEVFDSCTSLTSVKIPNSVTSIGHYAFRDCNSLTNVTIPSGVTSIGDSAFLECTRLTTVTIGDSVTSIGNEVFEFCTSLTTVTIGDSVRSIGDSAFYGCSSLTNLTVPNSVTTIGGRAFFWCLSLTTVALGNSVRSIGDSAFYGCSSLTTITVNALNPAFMSVDGVLFDNSQTTLIQYPAGNPRTSYAIPNSVTSLGDQAFYRCTSLTNVTVPNSVTTIGGEAFAVCLSLTTVAIGDSLTSIGVRAFKDCTSLTGVTIPSSVTNIGDYAFASCTSLTAISVNAFNPAYMSVDGVLFDNSQTTLIQYPAGNARTSYAIPNSITTIGDLALTKCSSLITVTIGDSVTSIGVRTFEDCTGLTSVTIPSSVTNIGDYAFSSCTSLLNVMFGNSVTNIGSCAFVYCTSLTNVTIPTSVTNYLDDTFAGCTSLEAITVDALNPTYSSVDGVLFNKSQTMLILCPQGKAGNITIPNIVTNIGNYSFEDCTRLTSVTIPNSVINIPVGTFHYCRSLTAITVDALNSEYSSLDGVLFDKSQTTLIKYPEAKAGSYTVPNSVTRIGRPDSEPSPEAFNGCTKLTSITIPDSVTTIPYGAFYECISLMSVTIPNSVISIGRSAFQSCGSLTGVTIPNSVTSIGDYAFYYCTNLSSITVDPLNSVYSSLEGVLFDKIQTALIQYPGGKAGGYTIPGSVTYIRYSAFEGCEGLTSVTIPKSVTSIGDWAFYNCTSLTSVTIPSSVTSIGDWAFRYCTNLAGVYFDGNAPSLLSGCAFEGNIKMTIYYLPGTTGWGPTFDGRPTALWSLPNPLILTTGPSFGVGTNGFGFIISWATNVPVVVEASTILAAPSWSPINTNTLTGGSAYFSDPQWTNYPGRFYRLRAL